MAGIALLISKLPLLSKREGRQWAAGEVERAGWSVGLCARLGAWHSVGGGGTKRAAMCYPRL